MQPHTVLLDVFVQRLRVTFFSLTILVVSLATLVLGCSRTTRRTIILTPTPEAETAAPGTAVVLGVPPGRQPRPKSRDCGGIAAVAPPGSWILYRPTADRKLVHVREVDRARVGVVVRVRVFEVESGRFVREENP